ncbi:hypothetical protein H4S07_005955, partial [Coemansia furcata]
MAFPAVSWPVHRYEAAVNYAATDAFDLGAFGHMLPSIGSEQRSEDPQASVNWNAASAQPQAETYGVLTETGPAVVLRPPTRTAQFLEPSKGSDSIQGMCNTFDLLHRDLDIPKYIIRDAFTEALDESDWDHIATKKGNV